MQRLRRNLKSPFTAITRVRIPSGTPNLINELPRFPQEVAVQRRYNLVSSGSCRPLCCGGGGGDYGSLIDDILSVENPLPDLVANEIVNVTDSLPDPVPTIDADPFSYQGGDLGGGNKNPVDALKEKAKSVVNALKDCAALFGGAGKANSLIDNASLFNVDSTAGPLPNPDPGNPNAIDTRVYIQTNDKIGSDGSLNYNARGDVGGNHIYFGNAFVQAGNVDPNGQLTLFFHELGHNNGRPNEKDDAERNKIDDEIRKKCNTKSGT